MIKIEPLSKIDIEGINHIFNSGFQNSFDGGIVEVAKLGYIEYFNEYEYNGLDIKIMYNNEMVGFYFLRENSILKAFNESELKNTKKDLNQYRNKNGLEGCFFCISKEFQKIGIGSFVVDYIKTLKNFDYIWGGNYKKLNNIGFWLKSREIISENKNGYITLMDI